MSHNPTFGLAYLPEHDKLGWAFRVTIIDAYGPSTMTTSKETQDLTDIHPEVIQLWMEAFEEREDYEICALIAKAAGIRQEVSQEGD